ncbi:MAG: hypothetical protein HY958_01020 [Bacteroidia bacterium]|nr:hypothetical protein [Bacteroidia bacterium]
MRHKLNFFKESYYKKTGKFGLKTEPLFYLENPTDKEMGDIITRELGWQDADTSEFTKHLDCVAEPFTNYIREHRYGYSRRICQLSNMIRSGEIDRQTAICIHTKDNLREKPACTAEVLQMLGMTESDLQKTLVAPVFKYQKYTSRSNILFAYLKKLKDNIRN